MSTTAKIGAFFLLVLAALGLLVMRIEDLRFGRQRRTVSAEVQFKDVAGLDDKSAVRIAGVRAGKVDGIRRLPDGTALAHLSLDPDVELREGAWGTIKNLGLLGDKYVDLYPGSPEGPRLAVGARIPGTVPVGFDELTKLASDIGKDVKELTAALSGSIGGKAGEEKLNRIVDNIGALSDALRKLVEANRENVDVTVANLREFSSEIRATLVRIDRILDENRLGVKGSVANIEEVSAKLKASAENLGSITGKLDRGEGSIGKLLNDETTVKNLNSTLESVKSGVDSFNTTLTRINRIELELGFGGEYLSRTGDSRGYFTLDVTPREGKFYRLELSSLPQGRRRFTTTTTTTTGPDGVPQTSKQDVETFEDEFGLSVQLGRRFKNTVLRAGLFESRGGVGIDHFLLKDQLQMSLEAFDFGRPFGNGHVKAYGRYFSRGSMYVTAGVDEVLNPGQRSVFVGAGLRWKDEDIKTLLGAVPLIR